MNLCRFDWESVALIRCIDLLASFAETLFFMCQKVILKLTLRVGRSLCLHPKFVGRSTVSTFKCSDAAVKQGHPLICSCLTRRLNFWQIDLLTKKPREQAWETCSHDWLLLP